MLDSVGLRGKADELAANLSHGEQRNLEIGIALATEPQLLCLDEPTAGMSAAETHDTMQLVRRIAKNLTILIVEHDMQVVMELAHRITVLHYGEILAEGTPAEIQQNPQGAGGLPQDMSPPQTPAQPLVAVEDIHTYYGKSHILHGVSLDGRARARSWACSAATASARAPRSRPSWASSARAQGKVLFEGRPITGLPAHKLARLGIAYVPEDRRIFRC